MTNWNTLIGQRVLVCLSDRSQSDPQESLVCEVSPSGLYVRLGPVERYDWHHIANIKLMEVLPPYKCPGT